MLILTSKNHQFETNLNNSMLECAKVTISTNNNNCITHTKNVYFIQSTKIFVKICTQQLHKTILEIHTLQLLVQYCKKN